MNWKRVFYPLAIALMMTYAIASVVVAAQPTSPDPASPTPTTTSPGDPAQEGVGPAEPGDGSTLPNEQGTGEGQLIEAEFQRVELMIQTVMNDRSVVASTGNSATVDTLLTNAEALLGDARVALNSGNYLQARGLSRAAAESANAAGALMRAQMADYGLPSQQAQASRELVDAYYAVQEITGRSANLTGVDVSFYVTAAQDLYTDAYDLYNAGTYEQAMQTAHVARQIGRIANTIWEANGLISGPGGPGLGGPGGPAGPSLGGPGGPPLGGPGIGGEDLTNQQPLTVPLPEF